MSDQTRIMEQVAQEINYLLEEESDASEISQRADNITVNEAAAEGQNLQGYDGRNNQ